MTVLTTKSFIVSHTWLWLMLIRFMYPHRALRLLQETNNVTKRNQWLPCRIKADFYMIATIATKKVERSLRLWSLSSFHIGWFPYDYCVCYDRLTLTRRLSDTFNTVYKCIYNLSPLPPASYSHKHHAIVLKAGKYNIINVFWFWSFYHLLKQAGCLSEFSEWKDKSAVPCYWRAWLKKAVSDDLALKSKLNQFHSSLTFRLLIKCDT